MFEKNFRKKPKLRFGTHDHDMSYMRGDVYYQVKWFGGTWRFGGRSARIDAEQFLFYLSQEYPEEKTPYYTVETWH